jgi:hypothetical protein
LGKAFSVAVYFNYPTQGCRYAPTAGLKLANAIGVNFNWRTLSAFLFISITQPRVVAPTAGLKLANAFGVNSN